MQKRGKQPQQPKICTSSPFEDESRSHSNVVTHFVLSRAGGVLPLKTCDPPRFE
jgi:hypothetical protein